MIFPSYIFLLVFMPVVLAGWYCRFPARLRFGFLTLASYVFYGWWDYRFTALMLGSTALDYVCGRGLGTAPADGATAARRWRKFWLFLSVVGNLAALGFFKYYDFFAQSLRDALATVGIHSSLPVLGVILPVGISFYTFQSMSYTISVYRGECRPTNSFLQFATFVSMFPQLVAGPIVRYSELERQFNELDDRRCSFVEIADGIWLFVVGLIKKVWIADTLAPVVAHCFDRSTAQQSAQLVTAWTGTVCFTFQLYFDFSGYSDMARGLGLMLGFRFPINFDSPYKAASPAEFWHRWHITLSRFLRDYLYIPLGGSRTTTAKTMRNLGITMVLGGLWHGAAWNFVLWGVYHGLLLIGHTTWRRLARVTIPHPLAVAMTFVAVMIGWAMFRANSLHQAGDILSAMAGLRGIEPLTYHSATLGLSLPDLYGRFGGLHGMSFLALLAGVVFFLPNSQQMPKPHHPVMAAGLAGVVLVTMTTLMTETPFLYFQF